MRHAPVQRPVVARDPRAGAQATHRASTACAPTCRRNCPTSWDVSTQSHPRIGSRPRSRCGGPVAGDERRAAQRSCKGVVARHQVAMVVPVSARVGARLAGEGWHPGAAGIIFLALGVAATTGVCFAVIFSSPNTSWGRRRRFHQRTASRDTGDAHHRPVPIALALVADGSSCRKHARSPRC